ncbi:MAG: hypothetical protein P1P80_05405 [ANME-2 cluster archaeon]|nr:hypothetical protein [ANME-2 cluster archaeon]
MDRPDINGRIESFDQSVRSLDRRLRAVERRLSSSKDESGIISFEPGDVQLADPAIEDVQNELRELQAFISSMRIELDTVQSNDLSHLNTSVNGLQRDMQTTIDRIDQLAKQQIKMIEETHTSLNLHKSDHKSEITTLGSELADIKQRLQRQENMNKITIGSIKVPVELSGIMASIALIVTGYLVWAGRWDIIRSTYYPTGLAMLFAAAVIIKFIMTNRQPETA